MLEVKHLAKSYGPIDAVRDVSFRVERGEVLGFLGPNGAGKTTTMRMITGFLPPTGGTAVVNGYDILREPIQAKKSIGYLPENAPIYSDMTVANYLGFVAELRGLTGAARRDRIAKIVNVCGLEHVQPQTIDTLSKGFRQRVCFAQALVHDPPVLIMDEPTDGLDPNQKHTVRKMIADMARHKVIVISTHILEEVDAVCSRAIIIDRGKIVANGTPDELRTRSKRHGAVELRMAQVPGDVQQQLEALDAARSVATVPHGVIVYPKDADGLFAQVWDLVRQHPDWPVQGMREIEGGLDEVFRTVTVGEERGQAAARSQASAA